MEHFKHPAHWIPPPGSPSIPHEIAPSFINFFGESMPPAFEVPEEFTGAVLVAHRPLNEMDKAHRVKVCYLYACLKWDMRDYLTNATLRERFGVEERNKDAISQYIHEAVQDGKIKPFDEEAPKKLMKYVPFWAIDFHRWVIDGSCCGRRGATM